MKKQKAVFLDKDGTLVENVAYNIDPRFISFYPGVGEALRLLKAKGYRLVLVTNQPGVALGFFREEDVHQVYRTIQDRLKEFDVQLDDLYFCPHHPEGTVKTYAFECSCRKPMPGMFHEAAYRVGIDLKSSWMIGDILNDVEAGKRAGCRTILVNNGNETEWLINSRRKPDYMVDQFSDAVEMIVRNEM